MRNRKFHPVMCELLIVLQLGEDELQLKKKGGFKEYLFILSARSTFPFLKKKKSVLPGVVCITHEKQSIFNKTNQNPPKTRSTNLQEKNPNNRQ